MTDDESPYSKHDLSFALGGIERQLENITKTQSEDRMSSAQWRTDIRADMKGIEVRLNTIQQDTNSNKHELDQIKPIVTNLEERAMMSKGAANMAVVIGKFAHIISALFGAGIAILTNRLFGNGAH